MSASLVGSEMCIRDRSVGELAQIFWPVAVCADGFGPVMCFHEKGCYQPQGRCELGKGGG
eukprot:13647947-Alexandrium_andersonii.AAC.1